MKALGAALRRFDRVSVWPSRSVGRPLTSDWQLLVALFGLALMLGAAIARRPLITAAGTMAVAGLAWSILYRHRLPRLFLGALGVLLLGYAFFSKAFAYLGAPPLFVGEMVLGLGLLTAVLDRRRWQVFRSPIAWLLLAFAAWCAVRTIPYLGRYGLDALRDGVVWGYSAFALLIPPLLVGSQWLTRMPERYARCLPVFLVWVPIGLVISLKFPSLLPTVPGTEQERRFLDAAGGVSVHLAGIGALLLVGLHRFGAQRSKTRWQSWEWLLWLAWLAAFVCAATVSRGGALAVMGGMLLVVLLRPLQAGRKIALVGLFAAVLAGGFLVSDISLDIGDARRKVSPQQIAENLASVFLGGRYGTQDRLENTREWRLEWWRKIGEYTLGGDYFWTGKGFGVNLAFDDAIMKPGRKEVPNRNPHNAHLTILARAGVPGAMLWVVLQGVFGLSLLRAYFRARRSQQEWWARVNLWILAYWIAFMMVMTFGVILEGPQGGIWFWSLFGFGISVLEAQRRRVGQPALHRATPVRMELAQPR